jgi:hypothetical protein
MEREKRTRNGINVHVSPHFLNGSCHGSVFFVQYCALHYTTHTHTHLHTSCHQNFLCSWSVSIEDVVFSNNPPHPTLAIYIICKMFHAPKRRLNFETEWNNRKRAKICQTGMSFPFFVYSDGFFRSLSLFSSFLANQSENEVLVSCH